MKEVLKLALSLGLTCFLAGSILVFANAKTADAREAATQREKQNALALVLGESANQPINDTMAFDEVTFYIARDADGKVIRLAGEAESGKGFGGKLKVMVSMGPDGTLQHVLVTEHKETPGLGSNATDRKLARSLWSLFAGGAENEVAAIPPNDYLDRFSGKAATGFDASSVDGISGVTISSRAVGDAVQRVCDAFSRNQAALLNERSAS
jgi:electron transport complex protein RnfG